MTNPTIRIIDGDIVTDREMTDAEYALWQAQQVAAKAHDKLEADKATAKQAVLDRLGITAAEFALLTNT